MNWPTSARLVSTLLGVALVASIIGNGYLLLQAPKSVIPVTSEDLEEMVRTNFPAEYASPNNPDNLALAFLISSKKQVLRRTTVIAPDTPTPVISLLEAAFPRTSLRGTTSGSSCFPAKQNEHGKFCVIWAIPRNAL